MGHVWCRKCGSLALPVHVHKSQSADVRLYACIRCGEETKGPPVMQRRNGRDHRAYRKEKEVRERG